jgi:hypothetical protein
MQNERPTENSPFTNGIGTALVALAIVGIVFIWFIPQYFHGTISQIAVIGGLGISFILGFSDEIISAFVKAITGAFSRFVGAIKTGKNS